MLNETVVQNYYPDLGSIMDDKGLQDKPQSIWNCDETSKTFEQVQYEVIAEKGVNAVVGNTSKKESNITIMACVNAASGSNGLCSK